MHPIKIWADNELINIFGSAIPLKCFNHMLVWRCKAALAQLCIEHNIGQEFGVNTPRPWSPQPHSQTWLIPPSLITGAPQGYVPRPLLHSNSPFPYDNKTDRWRNRERSDHNNEMVHGQSSNTNNNKKETLPLPWSPPLSFWGPVTLKNGHIFMKITGLPPQKNNKKLCTDLLKGFYRCTTEGKERLLKVIKTSQKWIAPLPTLDKILTVRCAWTANSVLTWVQTDFIFVFHLCFFVEIVHQLAPWIQEETSFLWTPQGV